MRHFVLFITIFFSAAVFAQTPTWSQMPDFPDSSLTGAFSFSIGNKVYMGGGINNNDFWEFDTATQAWTQKASIGGNYAIAFAINGYGYRLSSTSLSRYDPISNTWMALPFITQPQIQGNIAHLFAASKGASFVINNKAYFVTGQTGFSRCSPSASKRLYEYDPVTNIWTRKADFPGHERVQATGFALDGKGYVGTGRYDHPGYSSTQFGHCNPKNYTYSNFYRYDPATNTWLAIENYPGGGQSGLTSFVINDTAYVGVGHNSDGTYYTYTAPGGWSTETGYPGVSSATTVSAVIGQKAYIGALQNGTPQVWEFGPANPNEGIAITGIMHQAQFCPVQAATFDVDFQATGTFNAANEFTVQLSDASGSFSNPLIIGTQPSDSPAGSIPCTIPSGLADGDYSMRLVSSSPQYEHTIANVVQLTSDLPAPYVSELEGCIGLTVSDLLSNGQTLIWYDSIDSSTPLATDALLASGTYYASIMYGQCESIKAPASVNIIDLQAPPTLSLSVCHGSGESGATSQIPGAATKWYISMESTTPISPLVLEATTYYVSYVSGDCEGPRAPITISIYEPVPAPTISDTEICANAYLSDIYPQEDLRWFTNPQGPYIGFDPSTYLITTTRIYYVAYRDANNLCWSERVPVTITNLQPPAPTGDAIQAISVTGGTIADLVAVGENIQWYATSSLAYWGDNPLPANTPLQVGQTYYATQEINGCRGQSSLDVTVTANLGTNENDLNQSRLWPNPFSGQLNFELSAPAKKISLHNVLGQQVYYETLDNISKGVINISTLTPGTYIVNIFSEDGMVQSKVIKQ